MKIPSSWLNGVEMFCLGVVCASFPFLSGSPSRPWRAGELGGAAENAAARAHNSKKRERTLPQVGLGVPEDKAYFQWFITDLPEDLKPRPGDTASELLKEMSGLGIGEEAYWSLAFLTISEAAARDPKRVFNELLGKGDPAVREGCFVAVIGKWLEKDPAAVEKAIGQLPTGTTRDLLERLRFQELQARNPELAYKMAGKMGNAQPSDYRTIFAALAKTDPGGSISKLSGITEKEKRKSAISGIAASFGVADTRRALEWAAGLDGSERELAVTMTVNSHLGTDLPAALKTIASLENPQDREAAIRGNLQDIALQEPREAFSLVTANLTGRDLNDAVSMIVSIPINGENVGALREAVEALPVGESKDRILIDFATRWSRVDPVAVYSWLTETDQFGILPQEMQVKLANGDIPPPSRSLIINWGQ